MLKDVIKQLIMLHQNNIPFSLKERDIMLPVNRGKKGGGEHSPLLTYATIKDKIFCLSVCLSKSNI